MNALQLKDWLFSRSTGFLLGLVMLVPLAIGLGLTIQSLPIIKNVGLGELVWGTNWSPMRGEFGFRAFIVGSLWVTVLSFLISAPISLFSALYITQYGSPRLLRMVHPVIDILAGLPSVVYGVWGILMVVPAVSFVGACLGIETSGYSVLAGALVLSVMTIPFVLHMLMEAFRNTPPELKEVALSLGASYWSAVKLVVRQALPAVFSAYTLGLSKAFGETIAVLMVAGNLVQIPTNPFMAGYPLPALIANNYGEMMSIPSYNSAMMFGALLLLIIVMGFNATARYIILKTSAK